MIAILFCLPTGLFFTMITPIDNELHRLVVVLMMLLPLNYLVLWFAEQIKK